MEFILFLACVAMSLGLHCKADCPPPEQLTYKWLDLMTVEVSWEKPRGLQDAAMVKYKYSLLKNGQVEGNSAAGTTIRSFVFSCLTEVSDSQTWTFGVWTESSPSCKSSNGSPQVEITVKTLKPRGKIVKDFKCLIQDNKTNCSWDPVDSSKNLVLSYRFCGTRAHFFSGVNKCEKLNSTGKRTWCQFQADANHANICIIVETEYAMSTFMVQPLIPSPKLSVREEGNELVLSWKPPGFGASCVWEYEVCHTQCSNKRTCESFYVDNHTLKMAYDKRCQYNFSSKVSAKNCGIISSDEGDHVIYGTNMPPDRIHTVVAIIIPILLSTCVLLSCYCFRKHSAIICPNIPDPSGFIKDMMMNGSKEQKTTTVSVYEPVPEPVEPCTVSPVTETCTPQQSV